MSSYGYSQFLFLSIETACFAFTLSICSCNLRSDKRESLAHQLTWSGSLQSRRASHYNYGCWGTEWTSHGRLSRLLHRRGHHRPPSSPNASCARTWSLCGICRGRFGKKSETLPETIPLVGYLNKLGRKASYLSDFNILFLKYCLVSSQVKVDFV